MFNLYIYSARKSSQRVFIFPYQYNLSENSTFSALIHTRGLATEYSVTVVTGSTAHCARNNVARRLFLLSIRIKLSPEIYRKWIQRIQDFR